MASTKFQKGAILGAKAFGRGQEFAVQVLSSRPVADGATSKIYVGKVVSDGRSHRVALKVFVNNMADHHQQQLDRELRTVRRIKHPNILPYFGTAVFEFHKILISEYMPNGNLVQFLNKHPFLDRRDFIIEVGLALSFLHEHEGMVHGDVKCENVLVSTSNGRATALLADFGLSTVIEKTEESTRTATALRQQASIQFAAPELLFGESALDAEPGRPVRKTPQTDVYAFGMMVVQAFSGQPPWPGCRAPEIMMKIQSRTPHPRPLSIHADLALSDGWWHVCLRCSAHEPADRPRMRIALMEMNADTYSNRSRRGWGKTLPCVSSSGDSTASDRKAKRWGIYLPEGIPALREGK